MSWTIAKNSDILILDEPTSALDNVSREILLKYISTIKKEKIIIIVTHDNVFKTVRDEIITLE